MKNNKGLLALLVFTLSMFQTPFSLASNTQPVIKCGGLPGCDTDSSGEKVVEGISQFIADMLQYVAVAGVIALMLSGFMYLFSGGEEEKVNRAKKRIIWSLAGVVLSVAAWAIVNLLNNIRIGV